MKIGAKWQNKLLHLISFRFDNHQSSYVVNSGGFPYFRQVVDVLGVCSNNKREEEKTEFYRRHFGPCMKICKYSELVIM